MSDYISISDYRIDLRRELKGVDEAIIVDALDDANEHLEMMVYDLLEDGEAKDRKEAVAKATDSYGSPSLVARAYIRSDRHYKRLDEKKREKRSNETVMQSIFNVYRDPHSYLGIIYFLLLFPLGLVYFAYIITMLSMGLAFSIMLIGIPILLALLLSIYPIAWLHGRMTEAFLGIRLPKKKRKLRARGSLWNRLKTVFRDPRLYSSLFYLFLMFPMGLVYFIVIVSMIGSSVLFLASPILALFDLVAGYPVGLPGEPWFLFVQLVFGWILAILTMTLTLHVSNLMGTVQGHISRWLLLKR